MKKNEAAQKLVYLISDNCDIVDGAVCVSRKGANAILDGLVELGMLPPLNSWDFHMDGDHANKNDIRYRTWEK